MTGSEIVTTIMKERTPDTPIIKWWYREKDLVDFELVDDFVERVRNDDLFDGYCLLRMREMWDILTSYSPERLTRVYDGKQEVIEWTWTDGEGHEKRTVYPYTPESLLFLMNEGFFS